LWADGDDLQLSQEDCINAEEEYPYSRMCSLKQYSFIYVYPVWTMELCAAEDISIEQ